MTPQPVAVSSSPAIGAVIADALPSNLRVPIDSAAFLNLVNFLFTPPAESAGAAPEPNGNTSGAPAVASNDQIADAIIQSLFAAKSINKSDKRGEVPRAEDKDKTLDQSLVAVGVLALPQALPLGPAAPTHVQVTEPGCGETTAPAIATTALPISAGSLNTAANTIPTGAAAQTAELAFGARITAQLAAAGAAPKIDSDHSLAKPGTPALNTTDLRLAGVDAGQDNGTPRDSCLLYTSPSPRDS